MSGPPVFVQEGDQYVGEIRLMAGSWPAGFTPPGWARCEGQWLPIADNRSLYSLIGTTYGGDGQHNFALPDLRGRTAVCQSLRHPYYFMGEEAGSAAVALNAEHLPAHRHGWTAKAVDTDTVAPKNAHLGFAGQGTTSFPAYIEPGAALVRLKSIHDAGEGAPHDNMQPYLVLAYYIALAGLMPVRGEQ